MTVVSLEGRLWLKRDCSHAARLAAMTGGDGGGGGNEIAALASLVRNDAYVHGHGEHREAIPFPLRPWHSASWRAPDRPAAGISLKKGLSGVSCRGNPRTFLTGPSVVWSAVAERSGDTALPGDDPCCTPHGSSFPGTKAASLPPHSKRRRRAPLSFPPWPWHSASWRAQRGHLVPAAALPARDCLYVQCRVFGAQPRAVVEVFFLVLFLLWMAVEKWITSPFWGGCSRCFPARPRGRIGQEAEAPRLRGNLPSPK